jgi:hypothetical protein
MLGTPAGGQAAIDGPAALYQDESLLPSLTRFLATG